MSKTITAAATLQLVGAGQLRLDDPVTRYLADHPYGAAVTVRRLLSHTSGVPNPIPLRWVHPEARHATFDSHQALRAVLKKHPRPAFEPGTRFLYSNIGYWLLGEIVERVSGETFEAYVTGRVLAPLGIAPGELGYTIPDPRRHAAGYLEKYSLLNLAKRLLIDSEYIGGYEGRWLRIRSHFVNGPAFGGSVGSAAGFGKFLLDQLQPHSRLFDDATRQLFYAPQGMSGGAPAPMTLGWHTGPGFFFKEGGGGGFHCLMRVYPGRLATVVMTNSTQFDVRKCLDTVDPVFE
jgi:CubicO group peptidase (beta-lactamase class C family)